MFDPNLTFSAALASALADNGIAHACISPGSRNTPLIAGFAAEERIRKWPILDERSAGFFAVGLAKASGNPVALVCTSGTAAAEYYPAVVEAGQSYVPLIVLTADRPPELRGIGAPQSIDQVSLFGSNPVLFRDAAPPDEAGTRDDPQTLAAEAVAAATGLPSGPVHLNLPFREPLLISREAGTPRHRPVTVPQDEPLVVDDLSDDLAGKKGLIVAGRSIETGFPDAVVGLAAATGFPILADPLSGIRHGDHRRDLVLGYGDALAAAGVLDTLLPELVIRLGPIPTSKPIWQWLENHPDVPQILVEASGHDATHSATTTIAASPVEVADALTNQAQTPAPIEWTTAWQHRDDSAGSAVREAMALATSPNEPAVARCVVDNCPSHTLLTVGSSMPIRDIDTFGGSTGTPLRVFGNRGTNGIDGLVSSALGAAATGHTAVAVVGDVSMFHDLNVLGTMVQLDLPLTVVVINNNGGGIFHFLPQSDANLMDPATFETYLGTPHGTDFVAVGAALGIESLRITDLDHLARMLSQPASRPRLLEVRTDRGDNVALHRSIMAAVQNALSDQSTFK